MSSSAVVGSMLKQTGVACARTSSALSPALRIVSQRTFASSSAKQDDDVPYTVRQERLGRPLSPHVTIYAWPIAAISSVTHRITGGALTIGLYGMGIAALAGGDVGAMASAIGDSGAAPLAKFCVAFPLSYHFLGGLRHVYWEKMPEGLNPDAQRQTAYACFGVAGALSAGLAFV